jgi:hypothetical protein
MDAGGVLHQAIVAAALKCNPNNRLQLPGAMVYYKGYM